MRTISSSEKLPLTSANTKPKSVKTILKWDTVHTGKNANSHMEPTIYAGKSLNPRNSIEQENVNPFGTNQLVTMDSDANFLTMNVQLQTKIPKMS